MESRPVGNLAAVELVAAGYGGMVWEKVEEACEVPSFFLRWRHSIGWFSACGLWYECIVMCRDGCIDGVVACRMGCGVRLGNHGMRGASRQAEVGGVGAGMNSAGSFSIVVGL